MQLLKNIRVMIIKVHYDGNKGAGVLNLRSIINMNFIGKVWWHFKESWRKWQEGDLKKFNINAKWKWWLIVSLIFPTSGNMLTLNHSSVSLHLKVINKSFIESTCYLNIHFQFNEEYWGTTHKHTFTILYKQPSSLPLKSFSHGFFSKNIMRFIFMNSLTFFHNFHVKLSQASISYRSKYEFFRHFKVLKAKKFNNKCLMIIRYSLVSTVALADISFIMLRKIQNASPNINSFLNQMW